MGKHGGKERDTLHIGGRDLENMEHYTYLGVTLSHTGTFTMCKKELTEKAQKAMNKLKWLLCGTGIKKSVALKLTS